MQKQNPVIKNYILSGEIYKLKSDEKKNPCINEDFKSSENINLLLLFSMLH